MRWRGEGHSHHKDSEEKTLHNALKQDEEKEVERDVQDLMSEYSHCDDYQPSAGELYPDDFWRKEEEEEEQEQEEEEDDGWRIQIGNAQRRLCDLGVLVHLAWDHDGDAPHSTTSSQCKSKGKKAACSRWVNGEGR